MTNTNNGEAELVLISSSQSIEELVEEQDVEEVEDEEEVKSSNNSNQNITEEEKKMENEVCDENGVMGNCYFPAARIKKIIRSEGADLRITQESIFLINKATEKFLELLCEDVYANVKRDRRKAVDYKHISSSVSNGRRYDFLSDFVPEKIKVEDALSERIP